MKICGITAAIVLATFHSPTVGWAQTAGMGGRIMGYVVSDAGIPPSQAGALITLAAEPVGRSTSVRLFSKTATSGRKGEFAFGGLSAGTYRLCVHLPGSKLLDRCASGGRPTKITLQSNQMIDGLVLPMKQGFTLPIRVDDAGGHLERHEGKTKAAYLHVGVQMGNGPLVPAVLAGKDVRGRDYRVLVPYDSAVNVIMSSTFFDLADDQGGAIERAGKRFAVTVGRMEKDKRVTLRVTGGR